MAKSYPLQITMVSFASSSLSSSYQSMNAATNGLPEACFLTEIVNDGTTSVTISWDGVNDHIRVLAASRVPYNWQTNAEPHNDVSLNKKGTQYYIKGTAGTGNIYLSGFYHPVK